MTTMMTMTMMMVMMMMMTTLATSGGARFPPSAFCMSKSARKMQNRLRNQFPPLPNRAARRKWGYAASLHMKQPFESRFVYTLSAVQSAPACREQLVRPETLPQSSGMALYA